MLTFFGIRQIAKQRTFDRGSPSGRRYLDEPGVLAPIPPG